MKQDYIIDFKYKQSNSAGSKAKTDIITFLKNTGFKTVEFPIYKSRMARAFTYFVTTKIILSKIKSGRVVFQYPLYNKKISHAIIRELLKKKVKKIVVIHDIESLRLDRDNPNAVKEEIGILNHFDQVISHNSKMSDWLLENGLVTNITDLGLFDYDNPIPLRKCAFGDGIVFAGNLQKSTFLQKLNVKVPIEIMGPNPLKNYPINIKYCGVFDPDEVPMHLNKKFGLVWDGDSVGTCNGVYGHYMEFNNPHKVSLYLSSGIPVIIWKNAALADFIVKNKVGVVVKNLNNIDEVIEDISEEQYATIRKNTLQMAKKLRSGFFIKKAVL